MKKGEIYLVSFDPAIGKEIKKARPALIVQSSKIKSPLISLIPLSSQIENQKENDILIEKNEKNRLFEDSLLRVRQISSFDRRRCVHFVGRIDKKTQQEVDRYLKKHFGLQ